MQSISVRLRVALAMLIVAWPLAGCEGHQLPLPTAPTPPAVATPLPSAPTSSNWALTTVLTAVTGPDTCFSHPAAQRVGMPVAWQMAATRSETTVTFMYDVRNHPTDDVEYAGTVDGDSFTAKSDSSPVSFPTCADGTVLKGTFDGRVTGSFSPDGKHLTAKEVWAYHFSWGDVQFSMDWIADQR